MSDLLAVTILMQIFTGLSVAALMLATIALLWSAYDFKGLMKFLRRIKQRFQLFYAETVATYYGFGAKA